jgi:hypothetical protein
VDSFYEVVALAQTDRATASELFRFLSHPPNGPDGARQLLADVGNTQFEPSQNLNEHPSRVLE